MLACPENSCFWNAASYFTKKVSVWKFYCLVAQWFSQVCSHNNAHVNTYAHNKFYSSSFGWNVNTDESKTLTKVAVDANAPDLRPLSFSCPPPCAHSWRAISEVSVMVLTLCQGSPKVQLVQCRAGAECQEPRTWKYCLHEKQNCAYFDGQGRHLLSVRLALSLMDIYSIVIQCHSPLNKAQSFYYRTTQNVCQSFVATKLFPAPYTLTPC